MPGQCSAVADLDLGIAEPRLRKLYTYWSTRRGARCCPSRGDLDPLEFGYLLGNIMLVDVLRDPLRFRVRVHGTELSERAHFDLTGKLLDELPRSDFLDFVIERCRGLVETAQPLRVVQELVLNARVHSYEALWLPLSEDGVGVTMLMCALVYRA